MGAFYPFVQISMSDEGMALAAYPPVSSLLSAFCSRLCFIVLS